MIDSIFTLEISTDEADNHREIKELTSYISKQLNAAEFVDEINQVSEPAEEGSKSGEILSFSSLAVTLAPIALEQLFEFIRGRFNRPGAPNVKVIVKNGASEISVEFNSLTDSKEKIIELAKELGASI